MANDQSSAVASFYTNCNVFLTGGIGFIGKLLIQKLIVTCPDIGGIYLLIRPKKGKNVNERLEYIFNNPVFDKMKEANPNFIQKIHPIVGDLMYSDMGLSQEHRKLLIEKINIVVHAGATVNFHEKLKLAVNINIRGTKAILQLCEEIKNLKCLMHISTAYSNCNKLIIDEYFYEPPMQPDTLMKLVEDVNENVLDSLTPKLIGEWPNTYTYTKSVSEALIRSKINTIPVGMCRPSIVISTAAEPIPGWVDNIYGFMGYCLGIGLGLIHVARADTTTKLDQIPVDYVVNTIIAAIPDVANQFEKKVTDKKVIYNCVANENKMTIRESTNHAWKNYIPFSNIYYIMFLCYTTCVVWEIILRVFFHYLPALFVDSFLLLTGKKPRMMKAYVLIHKFVKALEFFTMKNFKILNYNVERLWKETNDADKKLFNFNLKNLVWSEYYVHYSSGIKQYIVKDKMDAESIKIASTKYRRMQWVHRFLTVIFYSGCIYIAWAIFNYLF